MATFTALTTLPGKAAAEALGAAMERLDPELAAVIRFASCPAFRAYEGRMAADIEASGFEPPAILCVGRAVLMRQVLDWHEETGDVEDVDEQFSFQMAQDRPISTSSPRTTKV